MRTITAIQQSSFSRNKRSDVGVCMHESSLPNFGAETMARQITVEDSNNAIFLLPKSTGKKVQRRGIKQSKNSSLYSKKPESEQIEVPVDANVLFGKCAPLAQCSERSRVVGQRRSIDGRRGDKRSLKQTSKTKYDSFFSKFGSVSNGAATEGGNILGTQLQSFNVSSYMGNLGLCGPPLSVNCTTNGTSSQDHHPTKNEDETDFPWFYIGMAMGYIVGVWVVCGVLLFKRSWRIACFRFIEEVHDWLYVVLVVNARKMQRKFGNL